MMGLPILIKKTPQISSLMNHPLPRAHVGSWWDCFLDLSLGEKKSKERGKKSMGWEDERVVLDGLKKCILLG